MKKKKWIAILLACAALFAAARADAAELDFDGYVCSVEYLPPQKSSGGPLYGVAGAVMINATSGPRCTGNFISIFSICSTGSIDSGECHLDYLYPEAGLMG